MKSANLAWNPDWLHPGESAYSLAAKVATANHLNIPMTLAVMECLPETALWRWHWHCPGGFDGRLRPESLQVSDVLSSAVHDLSLRYCEACVSDGFHAVAHQNRRLATCPVHGLPLRELCAQCGSAIWPIAGEPWRCAVCGLRLAAWQGRYGWIKTFKSYPGGSGQFWRKAELPDATEAEPVSAEWQTPNEYYWDARWRQLAVWFYNELRSVMLEAFPSHLRCANDFSPKLQSCPVARAFQVLLHACWRTRHWDCPTLDRQARESILTYVAAALYSREHRIYLGAALARPVLRALVKNWLFSTVEALSENSSLTGLGCFRGPLPSRHPPQWAVTENGLNLQEQIPPSTANVLRQMLKEHCSGRD